MKTKREGRFFDKTQKMHFDLVFDYEWNISILDSIFDSKSAAKSNC